MKKQYVTAIFSCLLFMLISSAWADTISIKPEIIILPKVGKTFDAELVIDGVKNLGGFQLDIEYDPAMLSIAAPGDVSIGDFLGSTGRTVSGLGPVIDNQKGVVRTGAFSFGSDSGPDGSGVLVRIKFTVLSRENGELLVKNPIIMDASANPIIPGSITNGILELLDLQTYIKTLLEALRAVSPTK